jgi:hypothetical protein
MDAQQLVFPGDIVFGIRLLDMRGNSSVTGPGSLTIASGAEVAFNHSSTIPGSVTVDGTLTLTDPALTLTINGTLELNAGGILNNPGAVRVGSFVRNGGIINGHDPVGLSGGGLVRIEQLRFDGTGEAGGGIAAAGSSRSVVLRWRGPPGQSFTIDASTNLVRWTAVAAAIRQSAPGVFEGRLSVPGTGAQFFRVRLSK